MGITAKQFAPVLLVAVALSSSCDDGSQPVVDGDLSLDGDLSPDDPLLLVPPAALEADPAVDCSEGYVERAPVAGQNLRFDVAEQARSFWLELPDGRAHPGPRPLLVAFGGTGESGEAFARRARLQTFVDRGFLVVAPDSWQNGSIWRQWDAQRQPGDWERPNADLSLFDALVRCLAAHHEVDGERVYVAGHSAGGAMANTLLQQRSGLLAGAIVASGAFHMTSPPQVGDLDDALALVTWGGSTDQMPSVSLGFGVMLDLVDEATAASQFYDRQPRVAQVACQAPVGHVWLVQLNDWMAELLLAHPRGISGAGEVTLPPLPEGASAACSTDPFVYESGLQCPESSTAGCAEVCDLFSDCLVEAESIAGVASPLLVALGFGDDLDDCGGCVARCEGLAAATADAEVLACFAEVHRSAICPSGDLGIGPVTDGVNGCCAGRGNSPYCLDLCVIIDSLGVGRDLFPTCADLLGPPACGADGLCDPSCQLWEDPDCLDGCSFPDGACDPGCPPGTDPDCDVDCVEDGVCVLVCPSGIDPDCPGACDPDGFCNFYCDPGDDPDCDGRCGDVDGRCCDDEPRCLPLLLCAEVEGGERCLTACTMMTCDYGDEEGLCLPIDGEDVGLCAPLSGMPSASDCDPTAGEECVTEYGRATNTTCVSASATESWCLAFCDAVPSGCDGVHYCAPLPDGAFGCQPMM